MTDINQLVEVGARAAAKDHGLDYDEVCGVTADPDEGYCDSGTCVASGFEEHDVEYARACYCSEARAVLLAILPLLADDREHARKIAHDAVFDDIHTRIAAIIEGEGK